MNKRKERPIIKAKMAEKLMTAIASGLAEEKTEDAMKEIFDIDCYLVLVIDKQREKLSFVSENISASLLEEMAAACYGNEMPGLFEEKSLSIKGKAIFEMEEARGVFFAEEEIVDNLSSEDLSWLNLIAANLILAGKKRELDARAEQIAVAEGETLNFDYQFFQKRLEIEWERAQRYNRRLSLILLDIDDFNRYGQEFGQQWKRTVLAETSQLIKELCRRCDIIAQYVADEIAIILPETDISGAFVVAERVREAICQYSFGGKDEKPQTKLTASLGVASYPLNTADMESLTREVEGALYKAKVTGRNRVCGPELPA